MLFKLPKFAQFAMALALCSIATCSVADINTDLLNTALLSASNSGELFKINNLLSLGAEIDTRDENGMTPLHAAAAYGYNPTAYRTNPSPSAKYKAVVELLINKGADVNSSGTGFFAGWTPLHAAAEWGFTDAAELLIANGAFVNARNNLGDTPLQLASKEGHKEVAELLISNGAKVNDKDNYGLTALFRAVSSNRKDVVELLIAKGADVNEKMRGGITPLHIAAQSMPVLRGDEDIILMLIRGGANVNAKNADGQTPFDVASRIGNNQFSALFSPEFIGSKPSFDCSKATKLTYIESDICYFPPLAALDRKLNDSYVAILKIAKKPTMVKDEQRSWLNNRNKICNQRSIDCSILSLMNMYKVRIEQLSILERNPSIDDDLETLQKPKAPHGATPEERISFLKRILQRKDNPDSQDIKNQIPYVLGALKDSSPKVRETGVAYIIDESILPFVIRMMVSDTDPSVRQSAAIWISQYTNNSECNSPLVKVINKHLDEILLGLQDDATFQSVTEVLGNIPPCCMSPEDKKRVIATLESYKNIQPIHTIGTYWSSDLIEKDLSNIGGQCSPDAREEDHGFNDR